MQQARSLTLEVLPAQEGDALLLALPGRDRIHHVLIDAGTPSTAPAVLERLLAIPDRRLDLVVVTHIDSDHIGGMAKLLADPAFNLQVDDVWFNGFRHLGARARTRGVAQAERLTAILAADSAGRRDLPWNAAFRGRAVARADDPQDPVEPAVLPVVEYPWGLKLTVLSPTQRALQQLREGWQRYLDELQRGLPSEQPSRFSQLRTRPRTLDLEDLALRKTDDDAAPPNGSSIAFLAEFGGRSLLFAADAHADVLVPALRSLQRARGRSTSSGSGALPLAVDLLKLPHHGSRANVTLDLLDAVRAEHYVTSTNGRRFGHPDEEAMARVITRGRVADSSKPTLWFNYASVTTKRWLDPLFAEQHRYTTAGPAGGASGVRITLDCRWPER
jgi:beta-lactamase superfamily II metal-dependent hydrolase